MAKAKKKPFPPFEKSLENAGAIIMDEPKLTTYEELQQDKEKLEKDISNLINEFQKAHGFVIKLNTIIGSPLKSEIEVILKF